MEPLVHARFHVFDNDDCNGADGHYQIDFSVPWNADDQTHFEVYEHLQSEKLVWTGVPATAAVHSCLLEGYYELLVQST